MHILDLAVADGIAPERIASCDANQYRSLCPGCRGNDTLIIWEELNRYYCGQCQRRGGPIQYMRDFHALSYKEACVRLGLELNGGPHTELWRPLPSFEPLAKEEPNRAWQKGALAFVMSCHKRLMGTPWMLDMLFGMGFTLGTIERFLLGWNPEVCLVPKGAWGLDGKSKIRIGRGIVVPVFDVGLQKLLRVVVYREGERRKGTAVAGSVKWPAVFGEPGGKPIVVLERELDAIVVQQVAGDICCPIALGDVCGRPDAGVHKILTESPIILFALAAREAEAKAFIWWQKTYPVMVPLPPSVEKHTRDFIKTGINLRRCILRGIHHKQ